MNETRITVLRQRLGWTQERLATESSVGIRTIQRLEAGHDASLETLSRVSAALQVPVRDLFSDLDHDTSNNRVEAVELRTQLQQGARDRATRRGLWPYLAAGAVVTLCSLINQHIGGYLLLGYWVGIGLLLWMLRNRLLEPRLSAKYPLSRRTSLIGDPAPAAARSHPAGRAITKA